MKGKSYPYKLHSFAMLERAESFRDISRLVSLPEVKSMIFHVWNRRLFRLYRKRVSHSHVTDYNKDAEHLRKRLEEGV